MPDADIREEIQNQSSRETKVQSLLGWLLYDDESGSGVIHFTRALMELTHESGITVYLGNKFCHIKDY